jgi:hypothetical protein
MPTKLFVYDIEKDAMRPAEQRDIDGLTRMLAIQGRFVAQVRVLYNEMPVEKREVEPLAKAIAQYDKERAEYFETAGKAKV